MEKPVIILGAGGHSKVLIDILRVDHIPIQGITDPFIDKGTFVNGIKVLGNDNEIENFNLEAIEIVNGIGFVNITSNRNKLYERFKNKGYTFKSLIHKSAILADDVVLSEGVQIMAGAILQTSVVIGVNSIINTGAVIEHDSKVGKHSHIASRAVLLGNTTIGNNSLVGAGSVIIQGVKIGESCIVGAGAVVTKDVKDGMTVVGVPAREVKKIKD